MRCTHCPTWADRVPVGKSWSIATEWGGGGRGREIREKEKADTGRINKYIGRERESIESIESVESVESIESIERETIECQKERNKLG